MNFFNYQPLTGRRALPAALGLLAALGLGGCVESYIPDVVSTPTSYLVVDGFINGNGRSTFLLSRSTGLAATATPPAEKGAKIYIVDNTGQRYALPEASTGRYRSDSLVLNPARQYHLTILTAGNVSYASDPVPLKVTPPIDDLHWRLDNAEVLVQLNTHDAAQQSRYYRWNFTETWEFNSAFESYIEYYPQPNPRHSELDSRTTPIYTCWRTEQPSLIKQASTTQLTQDALTDQLLYTIPVRAERIKIRYSVLVKQYVETAEEFAYNEVLRKNTEAVGTVNDPLPSQLTGNVHRADQASEPVLGFVSAHTVQSRRIFIDRKELPFRLSSDYDTPYTSCQLGETYPCDSDGHCNPDAVFVQFRNPNSIPIAQIADPVRGVGFSNATRDCADCRVRGTNVKPAFW